MSIGKQNYLHSINGLIGTGGDHGVADVHAIVSAIGASKTKRLILHFHGGLVNKANALTIAETLKPIYESGGFPLFFVWESGAGETVRNNTAEIAREPIFQNLVRKVLEYALQHLGAANGTRSIVGAQIDPVDVKNTIDEWFADPSGKVPPYSDDAPMNDPQVRAAAPLVDDNLLQLDLENDREFVEAMGTLATAPTGVRSAEADRSTSPEPTRMDADKLAEIAPSTEDAGRGVISMLKVALFVAKILRRVIKRFLKSRDHGYYATVVEEVLREFYVDQIGKAFLWNQMKKDTADAFAGDPGKHAGTAFLAALKDALAKGLELERIFLVGHSTGGIYISHFLEAVDSMGFDSKITFDIVLLAPANTHQQFSETVTRHGARIRWLRLFGMQDDVERSDGLLGDDWRRALYPSSLLYLVSGLLEYDVDAPIVGMQRFLKLENVFNASAGYAESDTLRHWLKEPLDRIVWSRTDDGDGRRSQSRKHGDFDNDPSMLESLIWIVTH
jgi:pimeloyl-ACP methyl ester carboxylesterase